ncbi:hypothetical protein [Thiohalophilus thiocyanatoxydans]|uniref:Uncharacterized protein n=1 Tax=Thiohalophilus thiocyanatoxydans TaxID=381308 RepID=A0A4R8IV16_9GAMM|nr:hypothetical protein [Thiohalophilus thiocyanatoxydans]TDY01529.1 hypothetical protein EDC23_1417 [Thiohalophilus thiocyanatoxydans]
MRVTDPSTSSAGNRRINTVLSQQSRSMGQLRRIEIYNDKFVKVIDQDLFGRQSYHLNLSMLEPWPVRHRRIAWRWLLGMICFALTTLAFGYYLWLHQDPATLNRLLPFIIAFILLTCGFLILFIYHSPNVTEFRSRYGSCPLLRLLYNKPDPESFRHFVAELRTRILAASQAVTFDKKEMLAIELKELDRLADEGVLTRDAYHRARQRIMNMHF